MIFANALRGLIKGGEAAVTKAINGVFDTATEAANLIPATELKAAALKFLADGRVNLLKAFDDGADDLGDVAAAAVDDATTLFANIAQAVDDPVKVEAAASAAIGELQTLLGQFHAGIKPATRAS